MNLELMKQEAEKRLNYLVSKGLHEDVLKMFQNNRLYYSDCLIYDMPILYTFEKGNNVDPEWLRMVKEVEEKYGICVYHITHCYTTFGELLNLIYVTSNEEEWNDDWSDLFQSCPFSYVINLSEPSFSEFGSIGIEVVNGGIVRVA